MKLQNNVTDTTEEESSKTKGTARKPSNSCRTSNKKVAFMQTLLLLSLALVQQKLQAAAATTLTTTPRESSSSSTHHPATRQQQQQKNPRASRGKRSSKSTSASTSTPPPMSRPRRQKSNTQRHKPSVPHQMIHPEILHGESLNVVAGDTQDEEWATISDDDDDDNGENDNYDEETTILLPKIQQDEDADDPTTLKSIEPYLDSTERLYQTASKTSSSDDGDDEFIRMQDILVVAAVDGTLAGVSRKTGKTLWRRSSSRKDQHARFWKSTEQEQAESALFQPLVSTSTTVHRKSWRTSAVPSIDGKVHLTAPLHENKRQSHYYNYQQYDGAHHREEQNDNDDNDDDDEETADVTVTTTVSELVARSPFLDNRGRIYTGTRKSLAVAIDGHSGHVLQVIAADQQCSKFMDHDNNEGDDDDDSEREVVWLGRVDHGISIQDPRSGLVDVQFSSGRIMSVKDMLLGATSTSSSSQQAQAHKHPWHSGNQPEQYLLQGSEGNNEGDGNRLPLLLSTPNGALAYRHPVTGKISWITHSFDTPVAFAVDAASGSSLPVQMVPDAMDSTHGSNDDDDDGAHDHILMEEFERQLELASSSSSSDSEQDMDAQTIFSQLASGQIYAMPLGTTLLKEQELQQEEEIDHLAELTAPPTYELAESQDSSSAPAPSTSSQMDSTFEQLFLAGAPQETTDGAVIPFYHPDLGYIPPEHFYTLNQDSAKTSDRRKYKKILKILGSWLPPTIALIFVMSFELGRRKRQKDTKHLMETASTSDLVQTSVNEPAGNDAGGVIQVCDDVILGYGGHGTVVFRGILDGRQVAVKRMLKAYHASADREISLLIESDGHANVVRYFLKEVRGAFVYLALELCDLSLHDLIATLRGRNDENGNPGRLMADSPGSLKTILYQIACGVRHLHHLRIVHRDLKPANILLADSRRTKKSAKANAEGKESVMEIFDAGYYVAKISDMGLGKQLIGQSSFGASLINESSFRGVSTADKGSVAGAGPGSVGWQAPEVMARRTPSDTTSAKSTEGSNPFESVSESSQFETSTGTSTSRSVDIFSLGCIFYSTLVPGSHPFGEWYEREANIMHNRPSIDALKHISVDAHDLIMAMIQRKPSDRPTAKQICEHPFFWSPDRRLSFVCEFSDRLEMECDNSTQVAKLLAVEQGAVQVIGISWDKNLDPELVSNVQKFRTYDPSSVRDLLRLIRNKYHHFDELSDELKNTLQSKTDGLMLYFEKRFPNLLIHCFRVCRELLAEDDQLSVKYNITPYGSKRKHAVPTISETNNSQQVREIETSEEHAKSEDVRTTKEREHASGKHQADIPSTHQDTTSASAKPASEGTRAQSGGTLASESVNRNESIVADIGDVIIWHGSDAARTFHCRGWNRSDGEWIRRVDTSLRKRNINLVRCKEDPKFRTRLCNHWAVSLGTFCPMRKKNKCDFAHGPIELRVKETKRNRWGRLVDEKGDNKNPKHSGGEDTYGAAMSIETTRRQEGKWNTDNKSASFNGPRGKPRSTPSKKKKK